MIKVLEHNTKTPTHLHINFSGNEFTTLEGVVFDWSLACLGPNKKLTVLRFMTFKDSPYETPPSIQKLEEENKKGHIVLLEGVKTGSAKVINSFKCCIGIH